MSILPIYAVVRTDDVLNNTNLPFSESYLKSKAVRENVAKSEGLVLGRRHIISSVDAMGLMHEDSGLSLDSVSLSSLVEMYHPDSSLSKYSNDRLNFKKVKDSTIYFYPKKDVQINWGEVEWNNRGLPLNIYIHNNESGSTYSARVSVNSKTYTSNVFSTSEEAVLAQKQLEWMKANNFFN